MIPDVKTILEMLEADQCSRGQALAWIEEHLNAERQYYRPALLDEFAVAALESLIVRHRDGEGSQYAPLDFAQPDVAQMVAKEAYSVAEAMLAHRSSDGDPQR